MVACSKIYTPVNREIWWTRDSLYGCTPLYWSADAPVALEPLEGASFEAEAPGRGAVSTSSNACIGWLTLPFLVGER